MKKLFLLLILATAVLTSCKNQNYNYDFATIVVYTNGDTDTLIFGMESKSAFEPKVYLGEGDLSVCDGFGNGQTVASGVRRYKILETSKTKCK